MAHVTPIGGANRAQIDYRLGGCGCSERQFDYRTTTERPLRWIGQGLGEVGLQPGAEFGEGDLDRARALMEGVHPETGEQLVTRKLAVYADAMVPLAPLVAAVRQRIQTGEVDLAGWSGTSQRAWSAAERAVERNGEAAVRRADEAGRLADAAGLDVDQVWGAQVYEQAYRNLFEPAGGSVSGEGEMVPRRRVVGNAGYDVTFTLPKSMSLLLAFAPDDEVDGIERVYTEQVGRTFDWLERQTAYGMRGKHGAGKSASVTPGTGFLGWAMVHRAARPVGDAAVGDPHWHVHVAIANMTRSAEDGRWSAVAGGGRDLMRHAPAVGRVLRAMTRHELNARYGVVFARSERTEAWEVVGIPDATLRHFSKRGGAIHELIEQLGLTGARLGPEAERVLEAQSRGAKTEHTQAPDATLREWWLADATAAGIDARAEVVAALAGGGLSGDEVDQEVLVRRLAVELSDPATGLTAHGRRFSRLDALGGVADRLAGGVASVAELDRLTAAVLDQPEFCDLRESAVRTRGGLEHAHLANAELYTTPDVIAAERQIFARTTAEGEFAAVAPEVVARAIQLAETTQGYELSAEQRRAVAMVATSGRAVETILGPPGTGKTTIMRAARTAWESAGYRVAGVATAAVAAQNMQVESGIDSQTVAGLLYAPHRRLAGVDVLVVDEANLTDDRSRAQLYEAAAAHGTKVVEIGDPRQLRGVGCGSVFGMVHEHIGGAELSENRRQLEVDERLALQAWRDGDYRQAWQSWADRGRVVATETSQDAIRQMVLDGVRLRRGAAGPHAAIAGVVMLAGTNQQARELNELTHAVLVAEGAVSEVRAYEIGGGEQLRVGVGDQVLIRINSRAERLHHGADVVNGYRGVVTGTTAEGVSVEWSQHGPDGPELQRAMLPASYIAEGGLELGYAMTTHKAEGLTVAGRWTTPDGEQVDGVVLAMLHGMDNPAAYVAASRHKGRFVAYVAREVVEAQHVAEQYTGPPETQAELNERLVAALTEQAKLGETNRNDEPVTRPRKQARLSTAERLAQVEAQLAADRRADRERHERDAGQAGVRGDRGRDR